MGTGKLLERNLLYYWRTNLAVVAGVAAAVATLAGALVVGESVRASLRELVLRRLGNTERVVSSSDFFREKLAGDVQSRARVAGICPLIALSGLVTHQSSGRRASGVEVYGVDERFWRFHGRPARAPSGRDILLSEALARELASQPQDTILVRVEKPSAIPAESLHGRKGDAGRTLRFSARDVLPAAAMGEFSIRLQQGDVRAVFVSLSRLQKELDQTGRINTILVAGEGSRQVEGALRETFALADLGIRLRPLPARRALAVESDRGLLSDSLAEIARATADSLGMRTLPILTYVANTIRSGEREIPYSVVAAMDFEPARGGVALNDWAARELGAKPGDAVSLEYYVWHPDGRLETQTAELRLSGVVPITGASADRDLAPDYPGITDSKSLRDWDPPFPIDLGRIRRRDEDYWNRYRTTPKAFLPLEKGQQLWQSRFGKLTSVRVFSSSALDLPAALESYRGKLKAALDPLSQGFLMYAAKERGLEASRGATDFAEYFLYFSFFLVASALLLAALFFRLGVEQRLREVGILRAMGFPPERIGSLFLLEGVMLAGAGSVLGLAAAAGYGRLILAGLETWWIDAVGARFLTLHISAWSLAAGGAAGVLIGSLSIAGALRGLRGVTPRGLLAGFSEVVEAAAPRARRALHLGIGASVAGTVLLIGSSAGAVPQVAGFFGAGTLWLAGLLCFQWIWLAGKKAGRLTSAGALGLRNATHRPGRSILCIALIASATFIIVAVEAFRRQERAALADTKSGSGGFPYLAESLLPLYYNPNSPAGHQNLNLAGLAGVEKIRFVPFRLRPGDDASCLNLYRPENPRVLGAPADLIGGGRFSFQTSLATTPQEKQNPWLLLETEPAGGAIPAIMDANSMTYVLHRKLGEEIALDGGRVRLRLVGALADSIFQSEILIAERRFLRAFPDNQGYRFFLLDAPEQAAGPLEEALSDYGFDMVSTGERLAAFHRVENTYLATFQALGGLGLLVGTIGLAAVLLRNVLERRRELALLRAVGYRSRHLAAMVLAENALLLVGGLASGTACALLAIAPALVSRGGGLPIASLGLLLAAVLASGLAASLAATAAALRSPVLAALRAE